MKGNGMESTAGRKGKYCFVKLFRVCLPMCIIYYTAM